MQILKALPVLAILFVLGLALYKNPSIVPLAGQHEVPVNKTTVTGVQIDGDKPTRTLNIKSTIGELSLGFDSRGVPSRVDGTGDGYTIERIEHHYPYDWGLDLGLWIAPSARTDRPAPFDIGLRYSPVRLAWGTISPDLLGSPTAAGAGISVYLPRGLFDDRWDSLGIGCAWLADRGGRTGFTPYAALSVRF